MNAPRAGRHVLLVGDHTHPEFLEPLAWLSKDCHLFPAPTLGLAHAWLREGELLPELIVVAQSRPGRFEQPQIEQLHRAAPMARLVALLGSWCEGETCSGDPWLGVMRVFWYEFVARLQSEWAPSELPGGGWSLPRTATDAERVAHRCLPMLERRAGLIAVSAPSAVVYEGIADACTQAGYSTVWLGPDPGCRMHAAAAGIWDDAGMPTSLDRDLAVFVQRVSPAPVLALIGFPRYGECRTAREQGAAEVLPKPYLVDDLIAGVEQVARVPLHVAQEAPAA